LNSWSLHGLRRSASAASRRCRELARPPTSAALQPHRRSPPAPHYPRRCEHR
jgi:hypothetical protein